MPKRDIYHFEIRTALEKDGWTITSYAIAFSEIEPDRKVILAVPLNAYELFFQKIAIQRVLEVKNVAVVVVDTEQKTVQSWIR
jgi:hypothetical protein